MRPLSLGKLPIGVLNETVLRMTGAPSASIATPPLAGIDFAAIRLDGKFIIVSADPVTGVVRDIGRYAINVSANDIATSGCRPRFAESVILLPEGADETYVKNLGGQIHVEAKKLGMSIVGGHTEVTPGLKRPIVVVTAFGIADRYVSSRDARPGDTIMMTKSAGLEGTAVILGTKNASQAAVAQVEELLGGLSVVEEAVAAYRTGFVHAMHDCTEGGVLGAVFEMSLASGLGFTLQEKAVPVAARTREVCERFSIDPIKLIGSGALLLSVQPGKEAEVSKALRHICRASTIGTFTRKGRSIVRTGGRKQVVREAPEDELWRVFSRVR